MAKIDAAGGLATKVVVPIPTVVSTTSSVGGLVWGQDPEAVRKANEAGLKALGVTEKVAGAFLKNKAFTLTDQTRFVDALTAVKAEGLGDYVDAASHAESPRVALFFVESAEMLKLLHGQAPVEKVLTDSRALIGLSGGRAVALLPLDYVAWTERVAEVSTEMAARAREELGAKGLLMRLTELGRNDSTESADITIAPDVRGFGITETRRARQIAERGLAAGRAAVIEHSLD